jgi:hypothetical protein
MRKTFVLLAVLTVSLAVIPVAPASAVTAGQPLVFHEITPCALFDTRPSQGGTGIMAAGESRTFHVVGSTSNFAGQGGVAGGCGIPGFSGGQPQTQMVYLNLVAIDPVQGGNLKVWATTDPEPAGGVVNYQKLTPNLNNSNSVVVGVRQDTEGNDITVKANVGSVHVRGVALGYLTTASRSFWSLQGNAGTTGSQFIGTTDNQPLNLRVNDQRALRLEPGTSPNVIGGSSVNNASGGVIGATIGGGGCPASLCGSDIANRVTANFGTVGGGQGNRASGDTATVGGGQESSAIGTVSTVGGGVANVVFGFASTVAGGAANTVAGNRASVGGGTGNSASSFHTTIGGGQGHLASGDFATVSGGLQSQATGLVATVGGGQANQASGEAATVPGGLSNIAGGAFSFASGRSAQANHDGAFVWGDSTANIVASSAVDEFTVRASGGTRIFSSGNLTTGVELAPGGGSWASVSDRAVKTDIRAIEPGDVLAQVAALPITTWRYRAQDDSIRHIGPMAQDFHAAFGVGEDERHITAVDADGVALAAIQGLNAKVEQENEELRARLATVESGRAAAGIPAGAWWALAAALGLLGLGLGRRWGMAVVSR